MRTIFDPYLLSLLSKARLAAVATMKGSAEFPEIRGKVSFYAIPNGTLVLTQLSGLPQPMPVSIGGDEENERCPNPFLGIHVHEGTACTPPSNEGGMTAFADAGGHLNPLNCPHPAHLGDLPPLLVDGGNALSAIVTSRFTVRQLIGHTVIVHRMADDFHTQPSGDSGARIACGLIRRV